MPKPVRLSRHALGNASYRGTTEAEVIDAIRTSPWLPAGRVRLERRRDLPFGGVWNDRAYATKQVRPIFADEPDEIVVITVYVYYF